MNIEENITIRNADLKQNTLVVGVKGSGKSNTILKPLLLDLLKKRANGNKISITVIESDNELTHLTKVTSHKLKLHHKAININNSDNVLNVMEGETDEVVTQILDIFKVFFSTKNDFFSTVHELIIKYVTMILKGLHGDDVTIFDIATVLKNKNILREKISMYEKLHTKNDPVIFLVDELLGSMKDKYEQLTKRIIEFIQELEYNEIAKTVFGKNTNVDLDSHVKNGSVITVTTGNEIGGIILAKSLLMKLQNRLSYSHDGIPHYIIINNAGFMINGDTEVFLNLSEILNISNIYAVDRLNELETYGKGRGSDLTQTFLKLMKNKVVFTEQLSDEDVKVLIPILNSGKVTVKKKRLLRTKEKEINVDLSNIHFFPKFTIIYQLVIDGELDKVRLGVGKFVPRELDLHEKT